MATLPALSAPDPTVDRMTGFLAPRFRTTSGLGVGVMLPYFITLGDSADLTVTPYVSASRTATLGLRYRQAFANGATEWNGAISRDDIRPGDVVTIAPNVRHWHGAAPDTAMQHLAIQEALEGGLFERRVRGAVCEQCTEDVGVGGGRDSAAVAHQPFIAGAGGELGQRATLVIEQLDTVKGPAQVPIRGVHDPHGRNLTVGCRQIVGRALAYAVDPGTESDRPASAPTACGSTTCGGTV